MHYSGKVVNNSQVHIGVFWHGELVGALQFGPSLDKRKLMGLVEGTRWNEFIELNRLAFTDALPRNSESRAIAVAMRLLRKHAPQLKWVVSFADATQCGDGTIYRASGFVLTDVRKNKDLMLLPNGQVKHSVAQKTGNKQSVLALLARTKGASRAEGVPLLGYQLRYIYFLDPSYRQRLTVPEIPYSRIWEMGAGMYRGKRYDEQRAGEAKAVNAPRTSAETGGSNPTRPL